MKTSIFLILCGYIDFVSSYGHAFGEKCTSDNQCVSHHCVSICESEENMCIEPNWYFLRHQLTIPDCVRARYQHKKKSALAFGKPRRIGQSCHSNNNCNSNHCVSTCDPERSMWKCLEPRAFYNFYNLDIPKCTDTAYVYPKLFHDSVDSTEVNGLGRECSENSDCYSDNCLLICGSDEKRCLEPLVSYEWHKLAVPDCIDPDRMADLLQEINDITNASDIEEVKGRKLRVNK